MSGKNESQLPTTLPPVQWNVREEGNKVIVEFELRDNYEAIELAEVIADGMREGYLEMEFQDHE